MAQSGKPMKALMAKHWNEEKLLAETERIEAMVAPHIDAPAPC